jgi:hypothetical protein
VIVVAILVGEHRTSERRKLVAQIPVPAHVVAVTALHEDQAEASVLDRVAGRYALRARVLLGVCVRGEGA